MEFQLDDRMVDLVAGGIDVAGWWIWLLAVSMSHCASRIRPIPPRLRVGCVRCGAGWSVRLTTCAARHAASTAGSAGTRVPGLCPSRERRDLALHRS